MKKYWTMLPGKLQAALVASALLIIAAVGEVTIGWLEALPGV